ncbi:MAG TPA: DUF393 domain-containing protein [Candidatus Deferrimicrobiaceae bacterium]
MKGADPATGRAVLIYDAECALCRGAVAAIEASSLPDAFEFLPCGSEAASRRFPRIPRADCRRAVHLVLPGGRVLAGGAAAPEIVARLPRYRLAAPLLRVPVVRALVSLAYRAVARNRRRIGHLLFP